MGVPRISKEDLSRRLAAAPDVASPLPPLIVDARLKYPYEHSTLTLPGAVRLEPGASPPPDFPRDRDIVLYDSDPEEIVAERVAQTLLRAGFRVLVLEGGIAAWATAKLPTAGKSAPQLAAPMGSPASRS